MLLALIVLGPQRLPDAARQIGKFMGELRRMSSGFQQELKSRPATSRPTPASRAGARRRRRPTAPSRPPSTPSPPRTAPRTGPAPKAAPKAAAAAAGRAAAAPAKRQAGAARRRREATVAIEAVSGTTMGDDALDEGDARSTRGA